MHTVVVSLCVCGVVQVVDPERGSGRVVLWLLKALHGGQLQDGHDRLQR